MSLINELQRRNVIRVSFAYLAGSWLLVQIADTIIPAYGLPPDALTILITILGIGVVPVLILAWIFELTPEGLKRDQAVDRSTTAYLATTKNFDRIIMVVLLLAVSYFAIDKFIFDPVRDVELVEEATLQGQYQALAEPDEEKSIAVLPFTNMSGDIDNEYFSDGLSEEILNLLAKFPELKVIGRTSSFAFKGKNEDLRVIGQALGVKTILEGSVRKSADRIRITAQLIDVSDGAHIWSATYERTMTDIFEVQDNVAAAIIDALQIHVGTSPTREYPTDNTDAYILFLKARALLHTSEWEDAEELLIEAANLDDDFAETYELLAYCYWYQCGTAIDSTEGQKLTFDAAAKALNIDPDLVLAQALYQSADLENYSKLRSIQALERAARKERNNPWTLDALVFELIVAGYLREAVGVAERFVDLEPLSPASYYRLFAALYAAGHTSDAAAALEISHRLDPNGSHWILGQVDLAEQRYESAINHFEAHLINIDRPDETWVRELVTAARDPQTGQDYLDRRIPEIVASMPDYEANDWWQSLIMWYVPFGFLDRYLELIVGLEVSDTVWTDADPFVFIGTVYRRLGFTAHPRYVDMAKSLGLIEVWEQRGPPDFCEKVGRDWTCE